jgi:hypothetical protein
MYIHSYMYILVLVDLPQNLLEVSFIRWTTTRSELVNRTSLIGSLFFCSGPKNNKEDDGIWGLKWILPIHDLGNFDPIFKKIWGCFLEGEGSQMQLIGDFYTSLGVEQNFAQDWSNYHPSIIVVVVNTNVSKQTWHDCGHDTKYVYTWM